MKRSLAGTLCLLVTLNVGGAFAQSPQPLDILGVQLGMPRAEAQHLLLSRQPPYSVSSTNSGLTVYLGPWIQSTLLIANKPGVYDSINLGFAPPPTESTVVRIDRNVCYSDKCIRDQKTSSDAPSVENFVRGLAEKLKSPTPTQSNSSRANPHVDEVYVWSRDGKFLSSAELTSRLREFNKRVNCISDGNLSGNPDKNFVDICGAVLSVTWDQEAGIIRRFTMRFTDVAGLFSAHAKSAAFIDAKKASQHQQELQRSNQNRPDF